jgi:hypothetical protein
MNGTGQIPRTRGGVCGVLLILLGLWGGLAPFIGPYFHFGFYPDRAWAYDSGRLYYSVIPGAAALVGGVLVTLTRNRGVGIGGGLIAALGGAWFVAGSGFVLYVLKRAITAGNPILTASSGAQPLGLRAYLESISLFSGVGILILAVGGIAMGRLSLLAAKDVADADDYYPSFPAASTASRPDLSQYPTAAGQFPSASTGPLPATSGPSSSTGPPFEPAPYPDTTTSQFPPESLT